ncbi:hypothetical protein ACPCSP_34640 [Streptomyces cinereoruber]|uniref:hypothetical protein n=1 Tax=Streptomyces cinereoruber TaxID=67260 RepID=UPI003C30A84E
MKDVTDVFCLWVFGGPSASAIRSAAILPEIGSWGIAALTALASSVSTATVTPYLGHPPAVSDVELPRLSSAEKSRSRWPW